MHSIRGAEFSSDKLHLATPIAFSCLKCDFSRTCQSPYVLQDCMQLMLDAETVSFAVNTSFLLRWYITEEQ